MDLTDLKTFLKVAETGSFSAAAKQLHVTQPAVSKRLANLESLFGTPLIDRMPRDARLTVAGKLLQERGQQILREVDNTRSAIRNLDSDIVGPLSMATSHHIGLHYLPEVIKKYLKNHPQVDLDLHFLASEAIEEALLAGEVELALLTLPPVRKPLLCYQQLWRDELCFVVGKEHPLALSSVESGSTTQFMAKTIINDNDIENETNIARRQSTELLTQLTQYRAILPGIESVTFQLISDLFNNHQIELRPSVPTNYLETIKMMVSVGLGWGVLPRTMLDDSLRVLAIASELSRELGVVFDNRRNLSNPAKAMLTELEGRHSVLFG